MEPYLCTSSQNQMQNKTSVTYRKSRRGDVAYQTIYNKIQKTVLFKGNKPCNKSIKANSDANKMLAKKKAEGNERMRLRREAVEREAARLAEEEQRRMRREDIAHACSEAILGQMTDTEMFCVKEFI